MPSEKDLQQSQQLKCGKMLCQKKTERHSLKNVTFFVLK